MQSQLKVWPFSVQGARGENSFQIGHEYNLYLGPNGIGHTLQLCRPLDKDFPTCLLNDGKNPIVVTGMTPTMMRFKTLPGNSEGTGNVITFSTYMDRGETCLSIVAAGPQQWSDAPGVSWAQANLIARSGWDTLKSNVQSALGP